MFNKMAFNKSQFDKFLSKVVDISLISSIGLSAEYNSNISFQLFYPQLTQNLDGTKSDRILLEGLI